MSSNEINVESLPADELLSKGQAALNASDFENSLTYLSNACKKFAKEFGDMSDVMFEPHFYYAKSLFEYDTSAEVATKEDENKKVKSEVKEEASETKMEEDDVSSFQLATENLECAKLILDRQLSSDKYDKKEVESKLADCYILTGHILTEEDQDELGLIEYQNALEIRLKHGDQDLIAESYLYLGRAYCNQYKWRDAKRYFENCKEVLEKIEAGLETKDESQENHLFLETINQCLEDVENGLHQVEELNQIKRNVKKMKEEAAANDLSNVVRKKAKLAIPAGMA